jgi:uncharacterized protein RhaS with RHS repeats
MASALPYTAARVERVVWAYRGPRGRRWVYAAVWVQPQSRVRLIVWTDRGRERRQWFDTEAEVLAEVGRLEQRLVRAGWTPASVLDTGKGYVVVSREDGE